MTDYNNEESCFNDKSLYVKQQRQRSNDIGAMPDVVDPVRKALCEKDFKLFCETYFQESIYLGWADFHLDSIRYIEAVVLHSGKYAWAMPRGSGKASTMDSKVLTTSGYVKMRDIKVGDAIASIDGEHNVVEGVYPQGKIEAYKVAFADGRSCEVSGEHLWEIRYYYWGEITIKTTLEVMEILEETPHGREPSIELFSGDYGTGALSDSEIDISSGSIPEHCFNYGRLGRMGILSSFLDDGGDISDDGDISYSTASKAIKEDVIRLVRSLGGVATAVMSEDESPLHPYYKVSISIPDAKELWQFPRLFNSLSKSQFDKHLNFKSITAIGKKECQCIKVSHPRELYITDDYISTHNTTLARMATIWSLLYGHRRYPVVIGATNSSATNILASIKVSLSSPNLLLEDFPEVCYPLMKLEGKSQATHSQTMEGNRTRIKWTADKIVLPTVEGSKVSGSICQVFGLTGGMRGAFEMTEDGKTLRPDLSLLDDPQTDESAVSPMQCSQRENLINGAVMKMTAPDVKMASLMPCTVISLGDLAHRMLDRKENPSWRGTITKMLSTMPDNLEFWEIEYRNVWEEGLLLETDNGEMINKFYIENREKLDEGCTPTWDNRIEGGDVSAIQTAMNVYLADKESFFAEYQNEPINHFQDTGTKLTKEELDARFLNIKLGVVPQWCNRIVAHADVGTATGVHYTVMGIGDNFQCAVITRGHLAVETKKVSPEVGLVQTLRDAINAMSKEFPVDNTTAFMQAEMIGIDVGYLPDICYRVIREHELTAILRPTKGEAVKAGAVLYRVKDKRSIVGTGWIYAPVKNSTRPVRLLRFDANYWKTFTYNRATGLHGAIGSLGFCGEKRSLREYFEHLCSEYRSVISKDNKNYDIWALTPSKPNHYLDTLVGCCLLGSHLGVGLQGASESSRVTRRRKKRTFKKD